jgi:hypothetical protein
MTGGSQSPLFRPEVASEEEDEEDEVPLSWSAKKRNRVIHDSSEGEEENADGVPLAVAAKVDKGKRRAVEADTPPRSATEERAAASEEPLASSSTAPMDVDDDAGSAPSLAFDEDDGLDEAPKPNAAAVAGTSGSAGAGDGVSYKVARGRGTKEDPHRIELLVSDGNTIYWPSTTTPITVNGAHRLTRMGDDMQKRKYLSFRQDVATILAQLLGLRDGALNSGLSGLPADGYEHRIGQGSVVHADATGRLRALPWLHAARPTLRRLPLRCVHRCARRESRADPL